MREFLGIIILIVLVWLHYKSVEESPLNFFYIPSFVLKLITGVGVGVIYAYYYSGGDTWNYFNQAKILSEVGFSNASNFIALFIKSNYNLVEGFAYVSQPRAAFMVKLVAIINLFSNSGYWITSLYFSFFSFIGIYKFSTWLATKFKYGKVAALALFVWPGFVFWSSGILKETLAVGLIFWIIPTFFEIQQTKSVKKVIVVFLGLYVLFLIKYYFAVVLIVTLLLYSISLAVKLDKKSPLQQILIWLLMGTIGFVLGGFLHPNLRFENIVGVIIENNKAFSSISSPQSLIAFRAADKDWVWVLINSPKAVFSSLFLPLNLFSGRIFQVLASAENWIILLLTIRGLLMVNRQNFKTNLMLVLAAVSYVMVLAIFLALSTPNLGTLARYKVAFMPIVLVLVFLANKFSYFVSKK